MITKQSLEAWVEKSAREVATCPNGVLYNTEYSAYKFGANSLVELVLLQHAALNEIGCDCGAQCQFDIEMECDEFCHQTITKKAIAKAEEMLK